MPNDLLRNPSSATPTGTGVLPSQSIERLIAGGVLSAPAAFREGQIQPASVDLRLGSVAYRVQASFLPGRQSSVAAKIQDLQLHEPLDLSRPAMLQRGCVYIIPLLESLRLPENLSARANPKSTTGRLDIFTRLLTDQSGEFDQVRPGYHGPLYVEVVPRTFNIVVQQGTPLNQLRFMQGTPSFTDEDLKILHQSDALLYQDGAPVEALISKGLWVTVDLTVGNHEGIVGFRAVPGGLIDLSKIRHYDPRQFWEPLYRNAAGRTILQPDDFYILVSKEHIRVPSEFAVEMVPYDTAVGEIRIHYAGFFDPGFGCSQGQAGTRGVLEVRCHEMPFLLEDGQVIGRLVYDRLLCPPQRLYGEGIGSNYSHQSLTLAKQFQSWKS